MALVLGGKRKVMLDKEKELNRFDPSDIDNARKHLSEICKDYKKFNMCIPPRRSDSDILFSRVFDQLESVQIQLREANNLLISWNTFIKEEIKAAKCLGTTIDSYLEKYGESKNEL